MSPAFSAVLLVIAFLAILGCIRLLFLACIAEDDKKEAERAEERKRRVLEAERAYEEELKGRAAE